jgi:hypothetical protein
LGVYDTLKSRLEESGREKPIEDLRTSIRSLEQMEQEELAAVLTGEGYRTIWKRDDRQLS